MEKLDKMDDQILGAFIDGHLDPEHSEIVVKTMHDDPAIREQVYQLRRAKDLMKLAFNDARAPSGRQPAGNPSFWGRYTPAIAASVVLLAVSLVTGVTGYYYGGQTTSGPLATATQADTHRVVLHISEPDPEQFASVLEYIDHFLSGNKGNDSQIEVVANAGGIDFMREDMSPFKNQIIAMMDEHDNVHFIACASGLRVLRNQGITPMILKGIGTDETAIDHIVSRLLSGWTYVKVDTLSET